MNKNVLGMTKNELFVLLALFGLCVVLIAGVSLYVSVDLNRTLSTGSAHSEERLALLSIKQEIADRFIGIFLTVISVLAAVTGILGIGFYALLRDKVERDVEVIVSHRVGIAQAWSIGATYNEAAYAQWREYEPLLQEKLSSINSKNCTFEDKQSALALSYLNIADDMVLSGRSTIDELPANALADYVTEKSRLKAYVNLLNGRLYAATARIIIEGMAPSSMFLGELDNDAIMLLEYGSGELLASDNYRWWETIETVGFFKYHVGRITGDVRRMKEGAELLRSLKDGVKFRSHLNAAPNHICDQVHEEYTIRGFDLDI